MGLIKLLLGGKKKRSRGKKAGGKLREAFERSAATSFRAFREGAEGKVIEGKRYFWKTGAPRKYELASMARSLRAEGHAVKIIKQGDRYQLYYRLKTDTGGSSTTRTAKTGGARPKISFRLGKISGRKAMRISNRPKGRIA